MGDTTKEILNSLKIAYKFNLDTHKSLNKWSKNSVSPIHLDLENLTQDRVLNRKLSKLGLELNTFINNTSVANACISEALYKIIELLEKKNSK